MMEDQSPVRSLLALTADIVAEYVATNHIAGAELPTLINSVHAALSGLGTTVVPVADQSGYTPAVSVRKSVSDPGHIISLIDGKPYRMLKRHLAKHGLTPADYRERYGLKADYPMTSPSYSKRRSALAKVSGLGRKPG